LFTISALIGSMRNAPLRLTALELALPSNGCAKPGGGGASAGTRLVAWRRGGEAGCADSVAAGGGGGGVHEAVVVGGSVQVGDVLLGGDEGESGMHG
jgi:hypothetical protein